ncbi:MAG: aldehyde dehydrogenase family protein [Spirochaetota bacterium]|nr:MAG: aldehyde dehydrogenase family protein [Spirochaetota bacterium]
MAEDPKIAAKYITGLVERARKAQAKIEFATQEMVDGMATRIAWSGVRPDFATSYTKFCEEEIRMGYQPHKYAKLMTKVKGALRDMKGKKSVGIVEHDKEKGIIKIAKPMGVVGALIPVTNGEATPFVKAICAIKTRNAIIMAPHPRAQKTNNMATAQMRKTLKKHNWPEDLIIGIEDISVERSKELMSQCDIIVATGGAGMVRAAFSSGTPSQGVGAGNSVCIVDETADLKDAADKIMRSKTFDYATSCSTENSVIIQEDVYNKMIKELEAVGGYLVNQEEKKKLQATMWDPEKGILNRDIVAQPAEKIAKLAKINLPKGKTFIMIPETGVGKGYPFSGEKLSVTATIYKWKTFDDAIDLVNRITSFSGPGHSCGIHTFDEMRIRELSHKVRVSRIMIRQPQCLANSGAWTNGMPMSMSLGCGSWGGNSTTSNITWEHMLNYTWVSYPIPSTQPTDEELFGTIMDED